MTALSALHDDIEIPAPRFNGNGMVGGEGRHFDAVAARADRVAQAQADLTSEFTRALMRHPDMTVRAPNCEDALKRTTVLAAIRDSLDERDGDEVLSELLQIVGEQAMAGNLRALAWVGSRAIAHGEWHGRELIDALEG